MKILDKYLLKTFLITFTTVFVILFFIFILQTVWLFISELAGKDLDFLLVVKFLLFSMPRIVPLVLPLSVLLASIMTFGSLSENYEFAAMKSSGISFRRAMHSITIFIILLSVLSFFFANNVIPYAEYKFINFRRNIAQVKPAMAIAEGQFSEVGNYTIKVEKKSGEKGNFLTGVTIHKKSELGEGNTTVIKAKKGELVSSENSNTLKLVLTDGTYYEDIIPRRYEERRRVPFAKGTFKRDVINIDLSKLNQNNMNSVDISNTNTMLNIREIRFTLDSLNKNFKKDMRSYADNIYLRTGISNTTYKSPKTINPSTFDVNDILKGIDLPRKEQILKIAESNVENTGFTIDSAVFEMLAKEKNINSHWIALYDKFMIAFSCLLMFFIGAPLGAIIRKGGLGLPIVFAVSIFIVFHFINTFGKRVAQENEMSAFLGVWMSSLLLTPLAILLTYRAINDIGGMISFDGFLLPFQKLFPAKKIKSENPTPAIINLDHVTMDSDDEWQTLTTYTDTQLIGIVKNAVQFNYSNAYRTKALKILDQRGITQEQLQESNNLVNKEYQNIAKLVVDFHIESKTALYLYFVLTGMTIGVTQYKSVLFLLLSVVLFVILSFRIYKSQKILDEIGTLVGKKIEPGTEITLFLGFPFYLFIYFYNKKMLKEALNQFR